MLGFLPSETPSEVDNRYVIDLWTLVQGEIYKGATIDTLRVVMLNIIGLHVPERESVP